MKNKKWIIGIVCLIVIIGGFIAFQGDKKLVINNKEELFEIVERKDKDIQSVIDYKQLGRFTAVMYETKEEIKMMYFEYEHYVGEGNQFNKVGVYNTTEKDESLIIIYGVIDEGDKYTYEYEDLKIERKIEDHRILDIYLLDEKYVFGKGKVFSQDEQLLLEF